MNLAELDYEIENDNSGTHLKWTGLKQQIKLSDCSSGIAESIIDTILHYSSGDDSHTYFENKDKYTKLYNENKIESPKLDFTKSFYSDAEKENDPVLQPDNSHKKFALPKFRVTSGPWSKLGGSDDQTTEKSLVEAGYNL